MRMLNQETGQTEVMKEVSLSRALSRGQLPAWESFGLEGSLGRKTMDRNGEMVLNEMVQGSKTSQFKAESIWF